jgi:hypothetical protein
MIRSWSSNLTAFPCRILTTRRSRRGRSEAYRGSFLRVLTWRHNILSASIDGNDHLSGLAELRSIPHN